MSRTSKRYGVPCPECSTGLLLIAVDSRPMARCPLTDGPAIKRRRVCNVCGKNSTTYEIADAADIRKILETRNTLVDLINQAAEAMKK